MAKKKNRLCYLCGLPGADTKDHIPPRGIFPKIPVGQLVTVPAHKGCNEKFSRDDELFRNITILTGRNEKAFRATNEQLIPSWEKNPGVNKELRSRASDIYERNPLTGAHEQFLKLDVALVDRQVDRFTRGLYYDIFKKLLSPDQKVVVSKLQDLDSVLRGLAETTGCPVTIYEVEPHVFSYCRFLAKEQLDTFFMLFIFFDQEIYMGAVNCSRRPERMGELDEG